MHVQSGMIANLSFKVVIALLYALDLLAMGAPLLLWASLGIYADLRMSIFFVGWIVVLIFSATLWLKLLAGIRKRLWVTLIERKPKHPDNQGE